VLGAIDKELTATLTKKQEEYDHWHSKIRESAKARQVEQKHLDDTKRKSRDRVELDRQIKNLEKSSGELRYTLKDLNITPDPSLTLGDADRMEKFDVARFQTLFPDSFDPATGFSAEQAAFITSTISPEILKSRIRAYEEHNAAISDEIDRLKSKNVVLGENYRRMVIACTGWTAEQVDEAADGLTECVKDLNENPLPEDVAIEILMKDRGQDW
jgi:hypothetical protein